MKCYIGLPKAQVDISAWAILNKKIAGRFMNTQKNGREKPSLLH